MNKTTKITVSALLTVILSYSLVNAWTNLSTVTSGDNLTETIWNNLISQVNETGNRVSGIFTDGSGNVGIGTSTPSTKLEVNGAVKATNFEGSLNGLKIASGYKLFSGGTCNSVSSPCTIDISSGGFSVTPICTISLISSDGTGYTENMNIKSTTSTVLSIWKGNYQNEGTTMKVNWICVGG